MLYSVPACPEAGLPLPGVLLLTLGSLWFWEHNPAEGSLVPHRLPTPPGSLFWSLRYQQDVGSLHCALYCTPLCRHGWCWWCASPPRSPPTSCWSWRPGRSRRAGRSLPTHVSTPAVCDHVTAALHCCSDGQRGRELRGPLLPPLQPRPRPGRPGIAVWTVMNNCVLAR